MLPVKKRSDSKPKQVDPHDLIQPVHVYQRLPKEYIKKMDNPNYDIHHIELPFRLLVIGASGSGKTTALLNFLNGLGDIFQDICVVCKQVDEPIYAFMRDQGALVVSSYADAPKIDDITDIETHRLMVFDDMVLSKSDLPSELYLRARKKGVSLAFVSQSYYAIPKMIRCNATYIIIRKVSSTRDLSMILKDNSLGMSKDLLMRLYKFATTGEDAHDKRFFMLIDLNADEEQYKIRRNFQPIFYDNEDNAAK